MQVSQINSSNTNFKALKGIYTEGTFKKFPMLADKVLKEVRENKEVMDFCRRWDTEIHLWGKTSSYGNYDTMLMVKYQPLPSGNKFKNFMRSVAKFFKTPKTINCCGYGLDMEEASEHLIKEVKENRTLDGQITYIENDVKNKAMNKAARLKKRETAK